MDPNTDNILKKEDGSNEIVKKRSLIVVIAQEDHYNWDLSTKQNLKIFFDKNRIERAMKSLLKVEIQLKLLCWPMWFHIR